MCFIVNKISYDRIEGCVKHPAQALAQSVRAGYSAFTLIELLIYLVSFSFFAILAFGFLVQTQRKIFADATKNEKIVRQAIAIDLLKRDFVCASADKSDWDPQNFVFRKTVLNKNGFSFPICVSWQTTKDGLLRIEGDYNFVLKKWIRKIVSKVNNDFVPLRFVLKKSMDKQRFDCVELNYAGVRETIFLKNRRV